MNQNQEFHNKWFYPSCDDIIKKIYEEKKRFSFFEKGYDEKKKVLLFI